MFQTKDNTGQSSGHWIGKAAITETSTLALMMALTLQATPAPAQDVTLGDVQGATQGATQEAPQGSIELPTVEVTANTLPSFATSNGWAPAPPSAGTGAPADMNDAASAFSVTGQQVNQRIFSRPAEALEIVPGLYYPAQRRWQSQPIFPARLQPRSRNRPRHFPRRHADEHADPCAWPGLCGSQYVDSRAHQLGRY